MVKKNKILQKTLNSMNPSNWNPSLVRTATKSRSITPQTGRRAREWEKKLKTTIQARKTLIVILIISGREKKLWKKVSVKKSRFNITHCNYLSIHSHAHDPLGGHEYGPPVGTVHQLGRIGYTTSVTTTILLPTSF